MNWLNARMNSSSNGRGEGTRDSGGSDGLVGRLVRRVDSADAAVDGSHEP
jgi:hypothetical protein